MDFQGSWHLFLTSLKKKGIRKICVGIGVFDGVHSGHAMLLNELAKHGREHDSYPVALTFAPHPRTLLAPDSPTKLLSPLSQRIAMLKNHGAKDVFVINFNEKFAQLDGTSFLNILCSNDDVAVDCITVGRNWRFGKNGSGSAELLENFCSQHNIRFIPVDELKINGEKISSANIRIAIANGFLEKAKSMLGYDFAIHGEVVKGFSFASGKLGHPTANIIPDSEILPPDGVYGAKSCIDGTEYLAAVNIGVAPSFEFNCRKHRIEVHLLDFQGNLYGREIDVTLLKYLRNERFFESAEALKKQIISDIEQIKSLR